MMTNSSRCASTVAFALGLLALQPLAVAAQEAEASSFRMILSSGSFGLPADAQSVDWVILNESPDTQTVQVTLWRLTIGGPKLKLSPGTLTLRLSPGSSTHNANSVLGGGPLQPGYYFEVIVATNDRRVLPTVEVWSDRAARTIPGARIGPRDFVDLR